MHSARTAMTNDLSTEIKITASADGVEAGVGRAKRSIADLAQAAATAGEQGGKSMQKIGAGGEAAARTMDGVTKNMVSSLQRQIAALESGGTATRQYQESIARLRGANLDTLKPYLDQLDAAKAKAATAAHAQAGLETRLGSMGTVASVVSGQLMALTASLSMGAMAAFVLRINDGLDALNDVKDATGSTIESISALEDVALRSGGSLDVVTTSLVKLNDVLLKAKPGSDAEQALRSIGLQATELRRLDPAEALRQVAVALSGYADDQNKARLVQELFGKSLREMAPFLADLAEKTTLVGKVTTEQAAAAERFNKQLFDLKTTASDAGRAMVKDMLPGLNQIATAMAKGAHEGGLLLGVYRGLAEFGSIAMGTDDLGNATRNAQTAQAEMVRIQARMQDLQTALDRDPGNTNAQRRMALLRAELEAVQKMATRASEAVKKVVGQPVESAEESPAKPQVPYSPGEDQAKADAAKQAAEALRRELAEQAKIMAELHGLSGSFADDWARLSRMYADGALSLDQLTQAQADLLAKQPAIRAAQEAEKRVLEDMAKATLEAAKAREGYIASLQAGADKLLADVQAQQEAADRMGLSRQAVAELDAAKLEMLATDRELQASKELDRNLDMQAYEALMAQAKAYRELANAKRTGAARETAVEEAKKAADEWQRTSDQINQSLTDALMRGFESGKDFAQNLRDTVVNMFKTMVLRPVVSAIVSPISGALLGGLGLAGSAAASQGQGINGVSTAISGASLLGSIGGSVLGGAGWLTGATTLGGSLSAGMSLLGTGSLAGAGAGLGMLAGALGPIALGIGLLSSAFSRKLKDQGIQGTLGGEAGFEGQQYRFYEGGLFRSDKTKYSAIDPELARVLAGGFSAVQDQVTDFAEALSLPTDRIKGFTTDIKVSFKGLDEAGIQKALLDALATGSNELAQQVLGTLTTTTREVTETLAGDWGDGTMQTVTRTIEETTYAASEFARDGEQAIDTLTRLATSVTAVNDWFERLGLSLYEASLRGADAASSLADLFGGLVNFSAAASSYYEAYYSEAERAAQVTREVAEGLAELGISMPASREGFRALVEAQDLSTEAGRATYAALLQLAPAFASVTASVQSAEDALEQQRRDAYSALEQQRRDAYSALERSAAAQKRVLQGQLQAARDVAGALESVFGVLHDNVRELYGEVESTRAQQAAQASQFIAAAVATALASGYLPDSDQLSEAIAAARGGLDASNYGGDSAERDYAALVLAGQLAELEDVAGKQLTDAQRTVAELERQTEQLDETLVFWRQQIDIASGTYAGVLSVSAAIDRLSVLLGGGGGAPGGPESIGGGGEVIGPAYRDRGVVPRADYGADVALTSFDKFKAWYQGHATNANVAALQSSDYVVPDWMRVSHAPSNDDEMFGAYLFFKNNPQFAADFEQIMTTGRSSMPTDGSTLVRSDLSKMPTDAADFFAGDRNSLLSYEAFGLDPVLGYRLYKDGPEQFGLDIRRENFTEWLRTHKWTPDGIVESNNTLDTARPYDGYKLPRWDTSTGNIVDLDGGIYSPDGRRIGTAGRDLMTTVYGAAFVSSLGSDFGDASSQVGADDYYVGLKQKFDAAIASGQSAQDLADEIARSTSMADVAAAYGISVAVLEENLRNGGATNIPKFAGGGDHLGGLRIVGERGWEVEATGPARIWNQQQLAQALSGNGNAELVAELIAEVRALRQEVAVLRVAGEATADNTGKSANVLVAVQRGNSLSQVAEPTF